jgi:sterol desaturase/sphingolipid hydroxylase (fatty acid hydroxylase superfamily)
MEQGLVRLCFFLGVFALIAFWELMAPRRPLATNKNQRWLANIIIAALNTGLMQAIFPVLPVGLAVIAWAKWWGLFNSLELAYWMKCLLSFLILDLVIYLQHVLFHYLPILWRLHRMHHTDLDIDVTTGNRFHPLEIILSTCIKLAVVALIGAPAFAVILFEIILNAASQFNHGNILLPQKMDSFFRFLIVTPDMHRVHHSVIPSETNSNFGFAIPWWDRLFGTYRAQPQAGFDNMSIGLKQYRNPDKLKLWHLLLNPFK